MPVASPTLSAPPRLPRVLAAVLVLLAQWAGPLASRGDLPAAQAEAAALFGGQFICHSEGAQAAGPGTTAPDHHPGQAHGCALCPACHMAAAPMLPAPDGAILPAPTMARAGRTAPLPPATGPPQPVRYAARPRGPPNSAA